MGGPSLGRWSRGLKNNAPRLSRERECSIIASRLWKAYDRRQSTRASVLREAFLSRQLPPRRALAFLWVNDMELIQQNDQQTMSSRDIVDVVEKRHDSVKRTMDTLESKGLITITQSVEPTPGGGKPVTVYHVGKRDSYVVVAQLSPAFTARLVDRWEALESGKAEPVAAKPRSQSLEIIEDGLAVASLLGVPTHYAQIEVIKEARRVTGVDYSRLLEAAPSQDNVADDDVMLEPSQMAPLLKLGNGAEVNHLLCQLGLQYLQGDTWLATKKAAHMCQRHAWSRGTKSGYNLKWRLAAVREFVDNR